MCSSTIQKYGNNPISIQWTVVRGDTAELTVDEVKLRQEQEKTAIALNKQTQRNLGE
jgi:hypothetical protein